jgi:L-ascorbate metabolism protein UlaG (beta-lactamase superfamily)
VPLEPCRSTLIRPLLLALGLVAGCATFAAPGYSGPRSDHFDGKRFQNEEPFPEQRFGDLLRWQLHRHRGFWPNEDLPPGPPPPRRVGKGELRVTFINHATVLIQLDSLNILTDPVWSPYIGPDIEDGRWRHRAPGIRFKDLPPIDVIFLSHNHYDHLDVPTLRQLVRTFHPRIVAGLGIEAFMLKQQVALSGEEMDLDWWQRLDLSSGVRVTFVPAQHWSGRGLTDHRRTLWGGFVIEGPSGIVYFAGDTGFGRFLSEVKARFGPMRLALLPIAPFRPIWYMRRKHMGPADAVRAAQLLGAGTNIAIHWGTFELGDDGEHEAADTLGQALAEAHPTIPRFWTLENGEARNIP